MARMNEKEKPTFPFLCLLVSGGHTLLLVVHDVNHYTQLGTTLDDAVGEAYDKVARLLEISWLPGRGGGAGAALEKLARSGDANRFSLPVPMRHANRSVTMDFSFAGLKTAVARLVSELETHNDKQWKADMAASFQHAVITHLMDKLKKGFRWTKEHNIPVTALVVSGGVASNLAIRIE